jgi:hypothetical protein
LKGDRHGIAVIIFFHAAVISPDCRLNIFGDARATPRSDAGYFAEIYAYEEYITSASSYFYA